MKAEGANCIVSAIFKMADVMNYASHRAVKVQEHNMKVVIRVLEKTLLKMVNVKKKLLGSMPEKTATDAAFTLRRLQEETIGKVACVIHN